MGLFAYFAPDDIPLDLISADVMSEAARADAVAALCEVSLLEVEHDAGNTLVSVQRWHKQLCVINYRREGKPKFTRCARSLS